MRAKIKESRAETKKIDPFIPGLYGKFESQSSVNR